MFVTMEYNPEPNKTTEQFFCDVADHLLAQGKKSREDEYRVCRYRTYATLACAAGCQIPDKLYVPQMEYKKIDIVLDLYPELKPYFPSVPLALDLQNLHDLFSPEEWKEKLIAFAQKHNFNWTPKE